MGHRPENRVTENRDRKEMEDKGQNKEERQEKKRNDYPLDKGK